MRGGGGRALAAFAVWAGVSCPSASGSASPPAHWGGLRGSSRQRKWVESMAALARHRLLLFGIATACVLVPAHGLRNSRASDEKELQIRLEDAKLHLEGGRKIMLGKPPAPRPSDAADPVPTQTVNPGGTKSTKDTGKKAHEADEKGILSGIVGYIAPLMETGVGDRSVDELLGIKRNTEGDTQALLSTVFVAMAGVVVVFILFVVLRSCFPLVYAERVCLREDGKFMLQKPHDSFMGWVAAAWNVTDHEAMTAAGLDGLMLLLFARMFLLIFTILAPITFLGLGALHWKGVAAIDKQEDLLSMIEIGRLVHNSEAPQGYYWVHAGYVWLVLFVVVLCVRATHCRFLKLRFEWLANLPEPQSTTLMVEGIPKELRSDEALQRYFVYQLGEGAVTRAYIVRRTPKLRAKLGDLESAVHQLETAERSWAREGHAADRAPTTSTSTLSFLSGVRVNAVDYYRQQVAEMTADVSAERERVEAAVAAQDLEVASASGFVTFTSQRWCRLASREHFKEDTRQLSLSMPPDPRDVIYEDLAKDPNVQDFENLAAYACVVLMILFWVPLVALASSLTSLNSLQELLPILKYSLTSAPITRAILQGVLATAALKILMMMLPTFLMAIIRNFLSLKSGAWAQLKLQNRFYIFQVVFVVFITTIVGSIQRTLLAIIEHPQEIPVLLATTLPQASHFYVSYIVLCCFTQVLELPRLIVWLKYLIHRCTRDPESARLKSEPEDQDSYGMGTRMATLALVATLGLVFSCVMPAISVVTALFFAICAFIYGYLLVFAETKKPDLGGLFWVASLRQIFFALGLYVVLMVGVLSQQQQGRLPAIAAASSTLLLVVAWRRFRELNWEALPFESVTEADYRQREARAVAARMADAGDIGQEEYVQTECTAPAKTCRDDVMWR